MQNRRAKVGKARDSDEEPEVNVEEVDNRQVRQLTKEEIERAELEATPVIPDSEISPAAYIFQNEE